jgi:hypothetical protein
VNKHDESDADHADDERRQPSAIHTTDDGKQSDYEQSNGKECSEHGSKWEYTRDRANGKKPLQGKGVKCGPDYATD